MTERLYNIVRFHCLHEEGLGGHGYTLAEAATFLLEDLAALDCGCTLEEAATFLSVDVTVFSSCDYTLEEAQEHCNNPTARGETWFDGYIHRKRELRDDDREIV